jgi:hypothetical protein
MEFVCLLIFGERGGGLGITLNIRREKWVICITLNVTRVSVILGTTPDVGIKSGILDITSAVAREVWGQRHYSLMS